MDIGLEIISVSNADTSKPKRKTMYLVFQNNGERNFVYHNLLKMVSKDCITTERNLDVYTQQWTNNQLSNFDYLMLLNSYAQRSFQDLTQYPVMPWVLKDFKSQELDLDDKNVYRDLSKPIGAMDPKRLADFKMRYDETPDEADKFLYGSHYSCPGYVIGFMLRSNP